VCEREREKERKRKKEREREIVRKTKVKKRSCIHIRWGKPEYLHFLSSDCSLIVILCFWGLLPISLFRQVQLMKPRNGLSVSWLVN